MRLIGLLTTYEDEVWLPQTLRTLGLLDGGVIVEGAYQETIRLGKAPRSSDRTRQLCQEFVEQSPGFIYAERNEESDPQQREAGLTLLKEHYSCDNTVMMIIDGDEEYTPEQIQEIRQWASWLTTNGQYISGILWSKVFLSEREYVLHAFPRLYLVTEGCRFVNDNFLCWPEYDYTQKRSDQEDSRTKVLPYALAATHHSYQCTREKLATKAKWWETRNGRPFPWTWDEEKQRPRPPEGQMIFGSGEGVL